jgi:hypothetical protein
VARGFWGCPRKLVDDAWHEFILDSVSYVDFCEQVFGAYLHHTPEETMGTPMKDALADTIRAWDRSDQREEGAKPCYGSAIRASV